MKNIIALTLLTFSLNSFVTTTAYAKEFKSIRFNGIDQNNEECSVTIINKLNRDLRCSMSAKVTGKRVNFLNHLGKGTKINTDKVISSSSTQLRSWDASVDTEESCSIRVDQGIRDSELVKGLLATHRKDFHLDSDNTTAEFRYVFDNDGADYIQGYSIVCSQLTRVP